MNLEFPVRRLLLAACGALASLVLLASPAAQAEEDFSGHWLTQNQGEALVITQSGRKAFLVFLGYAADGRATWYVAPAALLDDSTVPVDGPATLSGTLYAVTGKPPRDGSEFGTFADARPVGHAVFSFSYWFPERASLRLRLDNCGPSAIGCTRELTLRRFEF